MKMVGSHTRRYASQVIIGVVCLGLGLFPAWGQTSNVGSVAVTVFDPQGAVVPGAQLQLKDLGTNDVRRAETQTNGTYAFPNLPFGTYELTVTKEGFESQVFRSVLVQTGRITSVDVTLKVGGTTQVITVEASAAPIVEPESSTLVTTLDTKQVLNLPVYSRNVMSLAFLVPGWSSTSGVASSNGTWNNLPGGAVVSADFDGTPGISNRFRSGGFNYGTTAVQPRIEDVAEMTIQTGQIDLSGIGTSAMRISVVTRRGTNEYHGRVFEDFRNTALNANSWYNNASRLPRNIVKLNEFGVSLGGPILRDRLFFFGTWSQSFEPRTNNVASTVLSPDAQQGLFSYKDASGTLRTVNLLEVAGLAGLPSRVHPHIANSLQKISGVMNQGALIPTNDPNIYQLRFQKPAKAKVYFPTIRVDWTLTESQRVYLSYGQTKTNNEKVYAPQFPGGLDDAFDYTSYKGNNRIVGFGLDSVFRPTLVNQFHAGYLYQYSIWDPETLGIGAHLPTMFRQNWPYGLTSLYGNVYPRRPISSFYPLLNAVDNVTWQKGSHQLTFGASWFREQDHYWNGPGGEPGYTFGLHSQDPAYGVINAALASAGTTNQANARALYALLAARVSNVYIEVGRPLDVKTGQYKPFGAYNLNEIQRAAGFWIQDRWRLTPNLTLNYGLRWDIYGDNHDKSGYYSSPATLGDLWGPTPVGLVNVPGNLGGVQNPVFLARKHAYKAQWKNPSPAIAVAWSPGWSDGILGKLAGRGRTVIRAGYSLRHYTEGAQNFWAFASNSGQFFFQQGSANPDNGAFQAGSLTFGDPLPSYVLTPPAYSKTVPASQLWGNWFWGMNPNIRMPYVEQWNLGIQRQLGSSSVLEVRYVGNLSLHQWLGYNINEVNIFENGFLAEFRNAQNNLKINQANGKGNTFAYNGLAGQVPLPIFAGAFGGANSPNFANSSYVQNLTTGAAGSMAQELANNRRFFCNLVGTDSFGPCANPANKIPFSPGAGYPINFWKVNPYANVVNYLDAAGHTNYHGLQIDFRQRPTHGMQFNANYTWAKSLGIAAQNGIQGQGNRIYYTQRNFKLNYEPSLFDIRHVFRISGTYDLPFGRGRMFLNRSGAMDRIFGGWTLGTIVVVQSGNPAQLSGGYNTVNNLTDSGVIFNGITVADFQRMIKVQRTGNPWVMTLDEKLRGADGRANPEYLSRASTAGEWGFIRPFVYGPGWYNFDLSVNKTVPITERIRFLLQTTFMNVLNHQAFNIGTLSITSSSFGQSTGGPTTYRRIELRANIEF